jgi:drug/metabolite transporter (DMT)-like permease
MGVVILGILVALRKQFKLPEKKEWGYFALLGFLGITLHQWLQSNALQTSEAGTTAWIVSTTPIFMAVLGWFLLKERLGWAKNLGILLAFFGVLVVISKGDLGSISIGEFGAPGDVLVLISAVNWAVFSALSRRGLKSNSASLMMFYLMLLGWVFTSFLFLTTSSTKDFSSMTFNGWMALGFLGVFCSGLAYIAWYDALKALTTAETGAFLYLEPLVTLVVTFFILGEPIAPASLIGGVIILFGVWLVNRSTPAPQVIEEAA